MLDQCSECRRSHDSNGSVSFVEKINKYAALTYYLMSAPSTAHDVECFAVS